MENKYNGKIYCFKDGQTGRATIKWCFCFLTEGTVGTLVSISYSLYVDKWVYHIILKCEFGPTQKLGSLLRMTEDALIIAKIGIILSCPSLGIGTWILSHYTVGGCSFLAS